MEDVALFFHLLGAFSFVAGTIVAGVAFETARRREAPAARRVRRPDGSRGERACPREEHVVLLVDVLVQVELESVQPV